MKALLALVAIIRSSTVLEFTGAACVVAGVWTIWGITGALIGAGVALLLKSFEIEMEGTPRGDR